MTLATTELDIHQDNMLIQAPYKINDVISVKLQTGEELVCKLIEESDTHLKVKTPLTLVMSQQGLGMQQYMFTTDPDQPISIAKDKIIVVQKTRKDFSDTYTERTSGLVTAPPNLQVK